MRGYDTQQSAMFSYLSPEQRVAADHPLRRIRVLTDQVFQQLSRRFARLCSDIGRPSIPPEKLLRALLLQVLYTIRSERMLMEQLDYTDRPVTYQYSGLGLSKAKGTVATATNPKRRTHPEQDR